MLSSSFWKMLYKIWSDITGMAKIFEQNVYKSLKYFEKKQSYWSRIVFDDELYYLVATAIKL